PRGAQARADPVSTRSPSGLRAQGRVPGRTFLLATASQSEDQCFEVAFVPNTAAGQLRILTGFPRGQPPGADDDDETALPPAIVRAQAARCHSTLRAGS